MLTDERLLTIWGESTGDVTTPVYIVEQALNAFARAIEREARREALEEALRSLPERGVGHYLYEQACSDCAAAIRALIDKEGV